MLLKHKQNTGASSILKCKRGLGFWWYDLKNCLAACELGRHTHYTLHCFYNNRGSVQADYKIVVRRVLSLVPPKQLEINSGSHYFNDVFWNPTWSQDIGVKWRSGPRDHGLTKRWGNARLSALCTLWGVGNPLILAPPWVSPCGLLLTGSWGWWKVAFKCGLGLHVTKSLLYLGVIIVVIIILENLLKVFFLELGIRTLTGKKFT